MATHVQLGIDFEAVDVSKAEAIIEWINFYLEDCTKMHYINGKYDLIKSEKDFDKHRLKNKKDFKKRF